MKVGFMFPSCSYNIVLTKDELKQLCEKGHLNFSVAKTKCSTGRWVYSDAKGFNVKDQKGIFNDLRFGISEPVDDMEATDYSVQFLSIGVQD